MLKAEKGKLKGFQKRKSTRNSTGLNTGARESRHVQAYEDFHTYDEVAPDVPIYATVNKKRPADVHYAEIQVAQRGSRRTATQVKARQRENATVYATINFTPAVKYDRKKGTLV
ncbi:uncharacterized protein LOC132385734 isoform X3 [Hypanus sabinus]|uniref:uncharacterized protein LOC132385734 isoform X3 n=1 Tax=Hypanus sabinus TaxID=79690 RepID=UPI0028C43A2A|nr:uncharacterized protein LOC132385734 isoform X3 [Hypanus sabinus]